MLPLDLEEQRKVVVMRKGGELQSGESPCDRNCDQVVARTQPQPSITREGYSEGKLTFSFSHPLSPTSQPIANQCGSQRARGPGGTICRGQCAGEKGRVERLDSMFRRAEKDTHYP